MTSSDKMISRILDWQRLWPSWLCLALVFCTLTILDRYQVWFAAEPVRITAAWWFLMAVIMTGGLWALWSFFTGICGRKGS